MNISYDESFYDSIDRITDNTIVDRVAKAIQKLKSANHLREVTNIRAMQGCPGYYRLRFGDFRIGFRLVDENTIRLLVIDHRSKIYNHFPDNYA
jgi:mRNA interferase RelE/StbE